ncbi:MAG: cytochrome c-type biogenesis CcmF C-terminal domain-containing protein, partial [Thermoguttaceae bacterium]
FAAFLTRSGIFSSLHAFSRSAIGWMFLALMLLLAIGGVALVAWRRARLTAERPIGGIWSREGLVLLGVFSLILLTAATLAGTLIVPLASILRGPSIVLGAGFYNNVLMPVAVVLLGAVAATPLCRWRASPTAVQKRFLAIAGAAGGIAAAAAFLLGPRHPLILVVAGLAAAAAAATAAAWIGIHRREEKGDSPHLPERPGGCFAQMGTVPFFRLAWIGTGRRQYGPLVVHLGFVALAIGVAGSSLGARSHEAALGRGDVLQWDNCSIRCLDFQQRDLPDKSILEAQLEVSEGGTEPYLLAPAVYLHRPQNEWSTHVAIHSRWSGDFYVMLRSQADPTDHADHADHAAHGAHGAHGARGAPAKVGLTFQRNPMVRWMWASVWIAAAGAGMGLWPSRRRGRRVSEGSPGATTAIRGPHWFAAKLSGSRTRG